MRKFYKIIFIVFGILSVLLFCTHLLLTYRAKEILKLVVTNVSEGKYKAKAKKVEVTYYPVGIKITNLELSPAQEGSKSMTLKCDFINLKIRSLWGVIFYNKLNVEFLQVYRPSVVLHAKNKSGPQKKGIAETINAIQESLFKTFNELNVKQTHIVEAAIKIFSADDTGEYFSINHINIDLANIDFEKKENNQPIYTGTGIVTLDHPNIHVNDSSMHPSIGFLKANTANQSLLIDSLHFIHTTPNDDPNDIQFSKLTISKFNWERFLREGIFELDSVLIETGSATLNLIKKIKQNKAAKVSDSSSTYKGDSFIIHYGAISDIAYQLTTKDYINKKNDLMLMNLTGDSFGVKELSVIAGRSPVVDVEELKLRIKDFSENDESNEYKFSLGDISISNKQLILSNYQLLSGSSNKWGSDNKLIIPQLKLENYSLEDLMQKKLIASKITISNPELVIDILKNKSAKPSKKKDINQAVQKIMQSLTGKVDLKELAIDNASIILLPQGKPKDEIKLSGLSLLINGVSILKASSAMDFIHAIKELNTDGFTITNSKMTLKVKDLKLLDNPRGLYFGSVKGRFGKEALIDLKGVTVLNKNNTIDLTNLDGLYASDLIVDSGTVTIIKPGKANSATVKAAQMPIIRSDHLSLNNIVFHYTQGKKFAASTALTINANDFVFAEKIANWSILEVTTSGNHFTAGTAKFDAGRMTISQPGMIVIPNAKASFTNPHTAFNFETEKLEIGIGISSTKIGNLDIENILMLRPKIKIEVKEKDLQAKSITQAKNAFTKAISIGQVMLKEPSIELSFTDTLGNEKLRTRFLDGDLTMTDFALTNRDGKNKITAATAWYFANKPTGKFAQKFFNPNSVSLSMHNIVFEPNEKLFQCHIDTAELKSISQTIIGKNSDTLQLQLDEVSITNFDFSNKDSVDYKKFITNKSWWAKNANVNYVTPKQNITVLGLNIDNRNGLKFDLDSFSLVPRGTREDFWLAHPYEKVFISLHGGKSYSNHVKLDFSNDTTSVELKDLYAKNINIKAERDKTRPEDTVAYRPLLAMQLHAIPFPIKIDSVILENNSVNINEISKKTGQESHLFFNEINGYASHVKNYDYLPDDTLVLRVAAKMYNDGNLRLHFKQSYTDSLQGFWMRARMGKFDMTKMSSLLSPLIGVNIKTGNVDSLLMVVKANDVFAYGSMDLRYHKLSIKYADTSRSRFVLKTINWMANLLLRNHDNSKTNLLFKNRLQKRGIFNFWGKIALEGLLSNLGIKRDKKEIREFKKNIKKYNLPEKYWDDN